MKILQSSVKSLLLILRSQGQNLSVGTGFVAESVRGPVLLTNRHNLTGRHNQTGVILSSTGAVPDEVVIIHNRANRLGEWLKRLEPLYESGKPLWYEHPSLGKRADMAALSLAQLEDVQIYPYSLGVGDPFIKYCPSDIISVIGFPFGLQGGGSLAIWATGFVATEPDIDYEGLPNFLIDCRSRQGQSGSAVIAHRNGGMVDLEDGSSSIFSGPVSRFLGMYSGRINEQSDLGIVWKASALQQLVSSIGKS